MADGLNKLSGLGALKEEQESRLHPPPSPCRSCAPVAVETPEVNPLASKLGGLGSDSASDQAPDAGTAAESFDRCHESR
jgi:hypothetical protein